MGNGVEKSRAAAANPSFLSPSELPVPVQRVAEAMVPFAKSTVKGSTGSGVLVSYRNHLLLLTVAHNLRSFGEINRYQPPTGSWITVEQEDILYLNEDQDIAVLRIPPSHIESDWPTAPLNLSLDAHHTSTQVFVLGYPSHYDNVELVGVPCTSIRFEEDLFWGVCELQPGISGGPWVDQDGNVFALSKGAYQVGSTVEMAWAVPLGIEAVRKGLETAVANVPHEERWELGATAHITQVNGSDVLASPGVNFSYDWLQDAVVGSSPLDLRTGIAASHVNWPRLHSVSVIGTVEPRIDLRGVIEISWLLGAGTVFTREERGVAGLFQFRLGLPITPEISVAAAAGFELFHTKNVDEVVPTIVPELTYRF